MNNFPASGGYRAVKAKYSTKINNTSNRKGGSNNIAMHIPLISPSSQFVENSIVNQPLRETALSSMASEKLQPNPDGPFSRQTNKSPLSSSSSSSNHSLSSREDNNDGGGGKQQAAYVPKPYSVIIGRGKLANNAIGNKRLEILATNVLPQYAEAKSRAEKTTIVSSLVRKIYQAGGEFIQIIDAQKGYWCHARENVIRDKVGSVLRNMLHDKYRSSVKSKVQARRQKVAKRKSVTKKQQQATHDGDDQQHDDLRPDEQLSTPLEQQKQRKVGNMKQSPSTLPPRRLTGAHLPSNNKEVFPSILRHTNAEAAAVSGRATREDIALDPSFSSLLWGPSAVASSTAHQRPASPISMMSDMNAFQNEEVVDARVNRSMFDSLNHPQPSINDGVAKASMTSTEKDKLSMPKKQRRSKKDKDGADRKVSSTKVHSNP